jgi:hypothetical protein
MTSHDLCFVLIPFGRRPDLSGTTVDFDALYRDIIGPAVREAGLDPVHAGEEMTSGMTRKPALEHLILCKFAVADLRTADASVIYQLGVRHAVRPRSTVLMFSKGGSHLPFDVVSWGAIPYSLGAGGVPASPGEIKEALRRRLVEAREAGSQARATDRHLYELLEDYPHIDHAKTDLFRDQVSYSEKQKKKLAEARASGLNALRAAETDLGDLASAESAVVVDLLLSYRSVKAWSDMIRLVERMPRPLASTIMVHEQLALALNRDGRGQEAEQVLLRLLESRGPRGETLGLLGRVYKDRWEAAMKAGKELEARALLAKAVDAYLQGFEVDWRDAYPGINAVTLMELMEPPDPRRELLIPVVIYAVERRIAGGKPDYWDHATRLELAILARNSARVMEALTDALASIREPFEPETTMHNIRLIREARERRNEQVDLEATAERELGAWKVKGK